MSIEKRIEKLEAGSNIKRRCMVVVVVPYGAEGPTEEEFDQYRARQREDGKCDSCGGSCILDLTGLLPNMAKQNTEGLPGVKDKKQTDATFAIGRGYVGQ